MQHRALTLDESLILASAQVEVLRFSVRRLVAVLEKENIPELIDALESLHEKRFGKKLLEE